MEKRLEHPLYRCNSCGALLTALEITEKWEAYEESGVSNAALCTCGHGRIRPTNLNEDEEEKYMHKDQLSKLLSGVNDRFTKVWKQALWSIYTGEPVDATDDERTIASLYFGGKE